ncbi:MAG: adenylate/guanylate cyclase domain-containing protein [Hyphomicrobiales bacterium]
MIKADRLITWTVILLFSAAAGVFFNLAVLPYGRPMIGAVFGLFTGVPMLAFMRGMFLSGLQQRLRQLAFPLYAPASLAIYVAMIAASTALAGSLLWALGAMPGHSFWEVAIVSPVDLIYALSILAIIMFMLRVRDLIGGEVFLSLLTGRYHKPKSEERIFLFIDVVGSTQFAERFGDLRTQEYLGRFFASLAEPVRRYRGAIDDYVGDLAIVTWPLQRGIDDARCVRCVFALMEQISQDAKTWRSQFGTVPRFRAALHGGFVVAGEIGVDRHKIAYFGDTVNTTARLETLCRDLDEPVLISAEVLSRIKALPADVRATNLGLHDLRGRDHPLAVAALSPVPAAQLAAAVRVAA